MLRPLVVLVALGPLACGTTHSQAAREGEPLTAPVKLDTARREPRRESERRREALPERGHLGEDIAARATRLVGVPSLSTVDRSVPDDCTGIVRHVYARAGIDLMKGEHHPGQGGVTHIYENARRRGAVHRKRPRPGDLVFFQETYDRNRDGRRNDGLTHIGVVERVEPSGVVLFIHRGGKGIARARLFLPEPETHRRESTREVLNDYLRRASRTQRAYLTGELFVGYASPEPLLPSAPVASSP
jgi:hypothetical protein